MAYEFGVFPSWDQSAFLVVAPLVTDARSPSRLYTSLKHSIRTWLFLAYACLHRGLCCHFWHRSLSCSHSLRARSYPFSVVAPKVPILKGQQAVGAKFPWSNDMLSHLPMCIATAVAKVLFSSTPARSKSCTVRSVLANFFASTWSSLTCLRIFFGGA